MTKVRSCLVVAAGVLTFTQGSAVTVVANMNPIRKVVTLLQNMQKKVEAEGVAEKELYEKFMCYCKTGGSDLATSIGAATDKVPAVGSEIEASEGKLAQTKEDLKSAQDDRAAAKAAMAQAVELREKEAAAFAAEKAESDTNIAAMSKAIGALEKGVAGAFLQTTDAQLIRQLASNSQSDLGDMDRQDLLSFLAGGSGYAPQSGEIIGILKQMHETMTKVLADATATETTAIEGHKALISAKEKEVEALTAAVESKTQMIGELGVAIVQMKEDLDDTQAALIADQKFLAELEKNCATKTQEWEERSKTRADEMVALADTIKILNDDDALDLFKKTLPAPSSLMQLSSSMSSVRARALSVLRNARGSAGAAGRDRSGLDLLMLALAGRKSMGQGAFDKVITMCDEMVEVLKKEQQDDENKKEYCAAQFDLSDDNKKALERTITEHENAIATGKETIATLTEEIAALEVGIKALDKSVAEATEQRQAENTEYKDLMAANGAAKKVLEFAKNRLNQFYNSKLYKAPAKKELSAQGRIAENMALLQLAQRKAAPSPPPSTWGAYASKSEESGGVIAMIDLLIKDLDKEMTEAETGEKLDQADYETMMRDSSEKRATDAKSLTQKESTKADVEAELQAREEGKVSAVKEHMAVMKYISSLHSECDWLLQYFDVRKEAREGEIDSIKKAKAVLSGADFSLVQTRAHISLRGSA